MHHGNISSHVPVRTACQGLFPLSSIWQGIKLRQQFRQMIDGIHALQRSNQGQCARDSLHAHAHWHIQEGPACYFYTYVRAEDTDTDNTLTSCSRSGIKHLKESHMCWSSRWNHAISHNLIQQMTRTLVTGFVLILPLNTSGIVSAFLCVCHKMDIE